MEDWHCQMSRPLKIKPTYFIYLLTYLSTLFAQVSVLVCQTDRVNLYFPKIDISR